jgi:hypothetical protein
MIRVKNPLELYELFQNTCELLCALEEEHPYPSHESKNDEWEDDVRDFYTTLLGGELSKKEIQVLDAVLQTRHLAAKVAQRAFASRLSVPKDSWEWLLTTQQQEQRTEEWLREKVDMLTASEISQIWAGPGSRARLVLSKVPPGVSYPQRHAIRRAEGHAMDWGIRFEPVVKHCLEKSLGVTITDLGRIRHSTCPRIAASPDGLITSGPPELVGRLVEIKCPPSRPITGEIPFEYMCQMQVQMAVCQLPACEYVEAKFEIVDAEADAEGWITMLEKEGGEEAKYDYHKTPLTPEQEGGWIIVETYGWKLVQLQRTTVLRDEEWLEKRKAELDLFWSDVDAARAGTFVPPPVRQKKVKQPTYTLLEDDT